MAILRRCKWRRCGAISARICRKVAESATVRPSGQHPWLDRFMVDPAPELDNLLSGYARIAPFEGADAPDAARLLFGGLAEDNEARTAFDRALYAWLDKQRRGGVPDLDQLPLERWVRKVSEAFEIIGLLKLRHCALEVRRGFIVWNSWAERLVISEARDGRHAFWRTLALTQRLAADTAPAANPLALEPLWLRICERAGTAYPASYLGVGLLGLRLLPERDGAPLERPWMAGLACWASGQKPAIEKFEQQWWALKGLYPRLPSYWRRAVEGTLKQSMAEQMPAEIRDWWGQDAGARDGTTTQKQGVRPAGVPRLASLDAIQSLIKKAGNPFDSIKGPIESLIEGRRHYAEATGDSYYLVTTACNIGMAILKGSDDPVGRGALSVRLARQALAWQPANPFAWALWRDALARQGAFEAAEQVGWEAIQRFPEDEQWRNQLALLLAGRPGREADAEQLLRETSKRFPDDVVARTQLAELLIAFDRENEAAPVVDEIFSRNMEDGASFDVRARLLSHAGDAGAARHVLQMGVDRFQPAPVLRLHLRMLDDGRALPLKSTAFRGRDDRANAAGAGAATTEEAPGAAVWRGGHLRRLYHELGQRQDDDQWRGAAIGEVRRVLSEDPNLAYANYLDRALQGGDEEASARNSFTMAFLDAMKRKDAGRFGRLETSLPSRKHLIDIAKVFLFSDQPAADRALIWLKQEPRSEPRAVSALRGFLGQRFTISAIESGEALVKLIAANDNIEMDLIESALAGDELLLAA